MDKSIFIDSVIFFIVNIIIIIYVLSKKKIGFKSKIFYILLLIVFNSSFNIMIKLIHDYNIVIPRNFIWTYKAISSFSIMDILFILILCFNFPKIIELFKYNKTLSLILKREIICFFIGVAAFLINKGYFLDNGHVFIITCKGIVYFFGGLIITKKYINKSLDELNYFFIIIIILISGWVSLAFFNSGELWERYGQIVKIIDQEDATTISIILINYLLFKFIERKTVKNFLLLFVMFIQNFLCVYKINLVYYVSILFVIMWKMIKKNIRIFLLVMSALFVSLIFLYEYKVIVSIFTSEAIFTRIGQMSDYWADMQKRGIFAQLFGLGIGTPYKTLSSNVDLGEIKIIDRIYSGYKFEAQVPILALVKNIGIVGLIIYIMYTLRIVFNLNKQFRKDISKNIEAKSLYLIVLFSLFATNSGYVISGDPASACFYGFVVMRLCMLINNDKDQNCEKI